MTAYCRVDDLWSSAGWLPVHRDQLRAQRSVTSIGSFYLFLHFNLSTDTDTVACFKLIDADRGMCEVGDGSDWCTDGRASTGGCVVARTINGRWRSYNCVEYGRHRRLHLSTRHPSVLSVNVYVKRTQNVWKLTRWRVTKYRTILLLTPALYSRKGRVFSCVCLSVCLSVCFSA